MSDIPSCVHCGVKHPWLMEVNSQIVRMTWKCAECGTEQMVYLPEGDEDV